MAGTALTSSSTHQLSTLAWALATEHAGAGSGRLRNVPADVLDGLNRELVAAGILSELSPQEEVELVPEWLQLIRQAGDAPLRISCVARTDLISVHSRVALFGGVGLSVTFSRDITGTDGRVLVTGIHDTTTIKVFSEQDLWQTLSGTFPVALPYGADATGVPDGSDMALAASHPRATFHFAVEARTPELPGRFSTHRAWALSESLYAVKTESSGAAAPVLMPEPAFRMSEQVVWDVLGGHDFLASAAPSGAGNDNVGDGKP